MNRMKLLTAGATVALTASLFCAGAAQAEGVSRGALLASMCATCHGTDGTGAKPNPSINGMDVEDMIDAMQAFATKEEDSSIMYRHAAGYTDEEIKEMAEYLKDK